MKARIHLVQNPAYSVSVDELTETPSTLLVPKDLLLAFKARLEELGLDKRKYLSFLILNFRAYTYSDMIDHKLKPKLDYQLRNLDLQKVNFRPKDSDWAELRNMAWFLGMSICKAFIVLLELDLVGVAEHIQTVKSEVDLPTMFVGSGLEFSQNIVYYGEDCVEIQRILRIQKACYDYGIVLRQEMAEW